METKEKLNEVKNFINGKFVRNGQKQLNVESPIDGAIVSTIPLSTYADVDQAVQAASKAYKTWSATTMKERSQIFFKYRSLLEAHMHELTQLNVLENGKTYGESKAEVEKSMELCEFAVSLPQIVNNEVQEVSSGVECRTERRPIGVVASIAPFNFPIMVPHWTMPNALMLGNTMVMKPSELVPLSVVRIAELLKEAG
ncbi:MAG: malonate-semialdehyde dehydrogenase (acetylating)/methylmalonate-semialdehyde dehydrogenase, partial [Gammaproteobacteria bacterium]